MQHLDEGTIHAWLDGELSPAERAAAELHAASCAACAAAVAEARGFVAASSRILTALDAVPGGVLPNAEHAPGAPGDSTRVPRRFIAPRAWMAVAAVLVLGIVTVIATRPRSQDAALRVAEEREQAKPAAMAPNAGPAATDSVGTTNESSAPAVAAESRRQKSVNKRSGFEAPARKDASAAVNDSTPLMVAQAAAPRAPAPSAGNAPPPPASRSNEADEKSMSAPAARADSVPGRPVALSQIVISGAGRSTATGNIAKAKSSDSSAPQIVSRTATRSGADSVVTTIYDVHGVRVALTERLTASTLQGSVRSSYRDQLMSRADAPMPVEHSITWSDSAGRTRTLRGAMTEAELARLKAELFGVTP